MKGKTKINRNIYILKIMVPQCAKTVPFELRKKFRGSVLYTELHEQRLTCIYTTTKILSLFVISQRRGDKENTTSLVAWCLLVLMEEGVRHGLHLTLYNKIRNLTDILIFSKKEEIHWRETSGHSTLHHLRTLLYLNLYL